MRLLHDTFIWMKIKYLKKNKKAQSLEILFIILVSLLYFSRFSTRAKRWEMTTRMDKLLSKRENKKCSVWPDVKIKSSSSLYKSCPKNRRSFSKSRPSLFKSSPSLSKSCSKVDKPVWLKSDGFHKCRWSHQTFGLLL